MGGVQKAASLFQSEGLLRHCLEAFRGRLTIGGVVEALVWTRVGAGGGAADCDGVVMLA